jgi:hypothetical protein
METTEDRELTRARAAKEQAKRLLSGVEGVAGIGLTRTGSGVSLRVNLEETPAPGHPLPDEIAGVPVSYRVVGRIRKQGVLASG